VKSHDIQLLLFDLALILILARVLGATARRLGQPPVLGEILAGILLGPTLFSGTITRHLFPIELRPPLVAVASLGLVLFMFIVGYELDGALIKGRERIAVSVSLGSIAVPVVAGFMLGIWLANRHHPHHVVPFRAVRRSGHVGDRVSGAGPNPHRSRHAPHPDRRAGDSERSGRRHRGVVAARRRRDDRE